MTAQVELNDVAVRLQKLGVQDQVTVLARLAEGRFTGSFSPDQIEQLFAELTIPQPRDVADVIGKLRQKQFVTSTSRGQWRLTPIGRQRSLQLFADIDIAALMAGAAAGGAAFLGSTFHTVVPPALAPPELILPLQKFLSKHPFETNIFGMTRFPSEDGGTGDPLAGALEAAKNACQMHGFEFHLASDRAIHRDLWTNVAGHMWASRYGIAFFENATDEGLNHNLTIEVGGMLMTGRLCALLKDRTLPKMPTDLVGQIYKDVDVLAPSTIDEAIHRWLTEDLGMARCRTCPPAMAAPYAFK